MTIASTRPSDPKSICRAQSSTFCLIAAVFAILMTACSSPAPVVFSHKFHREKFRLSGQEIMGMEFLPSTNVVAQAESGDANAAPTSAGVVLVKQGTPMRVTQVGPNWIRVSVRQGSEGVPFLADRDVDGSGTTDYFLATTVEGSDELVMVKNVPGHLATYQGVRYEIVEGYAAMLTCDWGMIEELIDKRGLGEPR